MISVYCLSGCPNALQFEQCHSCNAECNNRTLNFLITFSLYILNSKVVTAHKDKQHTWQAIVILWYFIWTFTGPEYVIVILRMITFLYVYFCVETQFSLWHKDNRKLIFRNVISLTVCEYYIIYSLWNWTMCETIHQAVILCYTQHMFYEIPSQKIIKSGCNPRMLHIEVSHHFSEVC